jgi:hypothetical protein
VACGPDGRARGGRTMTKLRIGVVGLGVGRLHVLALHALRRACFDLVAVADPTPARRRQARILGIKGVPDPRRAAGRSASTWSTSAPHRTSTRPRWSSALEAGVDVVCEKPLVDSVAAVDRLAEAEARTGRRVAPVFQYRWGGGSQKLRRLHRRRDARPAARRHERDDVEAGRRVLRRAVARHLGGRARRRGPQPRHPPPRPADVAGRRARGDRRPHRHARRSTSRWRTPRLPCSPRSMAR